MMDVDPKTQRLNTAKVYYSPNCDNRPPDMPIDLVVIHGISLPPGEYGGGHIEALFTNNLDPNAHPYFNQIADLRVSAHLLLARDGRVSQFVRFDRRAWHAGKSRFGDRARCNDFSIGIELEGTDHTAYTSIQYETLIDVLAALKRAYPSLRAICGHEHIAPGRKTDPGPAFDWGRLSGHLPHDLSLQF